tara:strand:- start:7593 stop:7997 length:405 start_codon:yes stop_codon:yes gene_type:complete
MAIKDIHKWEKAAIMVLNLDGWELEHTGEGMEWYDAKGKTPKGHDCVVEMKFRDKYYEDKLIEKDKLERLLSLGVVAIYFVADTKGNYMYWLNDLKLPKVTPLYCPKTTLWNSGKVKKDCYLLKESEAVVININ